MGWQERFRELGERLTAGEITTDEYRALSEEILADADREAAARTQPAPAERVHIPTSAAWEAPSGEMTQIVGTRDETTVVPEPGARTVGGALAGDNEAEN